jgi:Sec-independent protein secretion pathway component TatC
MFLVGLVFEIPYLFWHSVDFLKTSLLVKEYKKLSNFFLFFTFSLLLLNLSFYFILFPKFWFFFQNFNFSSESQTLRFFLELRVQEYFKFVLDFLYTINIFIIIFYFLTFLILFFGLEKFIYWKKLFIFINIVFATLLSPPDVYSQILFLFILTIFFEFFLFGFILYLKYKTSKVAY